MSRDDGLRIDAASRERRRQQTECDRCLVESVANALVRRIDDRGAPQFQIVAGNIKVSDALQKLTRSEGIIPALESTHALVEGVKRAKQMRSDELLVINLSGRGDKDIFTIAKREGISL